MQPVNAVADGANANPKLREARLWRRFREHLNTNEVLVDKARTLAPFLCKSVHRESELLIQRLRERNKFVLDSQLWPVFLEQTFLLVHYLDRLSLVLLPAQRNSIFLDRVMLELAEFLAGAYADEDDARRFRKLFPEWCTERQKQYAEYKRMLPDLDDSPAETLFWEFERKLAGSLGLHEDPSVMSVIDQSVMSLIEVLNLGELITGQATPVEYVTNQF